MFCYSLIDESNVKTRSDSFGWNQYYNVDKVSETPHLDSLLIANRFTSPSLQQIYWSLLKNQLQYIEVY